MAILGLSAQKVPPYSPFSVTPGTPGPGSLLPSALILTVPQGQLMSLYLRKLPALTLTGFSPPEPSKPGQQHCLIWLSHWQGSESGKQGLGTVILPAQDT